MKSPFLELLNVFAMQTHAESLIDLKSRQCVYNYVNIALLVELLNG